jgi:hypothetical protein
METLERFGAFLSVFGLMAVWEYWRPRRLLAQSRRERWVTNLGLSEYRTPLNLGQLLLLPFQGDAGRTPFAGTSPVHV